MKRYLNYFTPGEYALWGISAAAIVVSHLLFQGGGGVLLPAGGAAHGEPGPQHRIRDHQLLGGVSDLPPQCLVRRRLCRQRPGADRPVGTGGGKRPGLHPGHHQLYDLFHERYVRLYQLEKTGAHTALCVIPGHKIEKGELHFCGSPFVFPGAGTKNPRCKTAPGIRISL